MMKKTVIVALCLALSSFALVGCSGKSEPFEEKKLYAGSTGQRDQSCCAG